MATNKGILQEALADKDDTRASQIDSSVSILVIDSGVGGLSVCQSILAQQPELQIIYFADSAYFPYGVLPEEELSARLKFIVGNMLSLHQPKLVVLACNTVSTLMLPELRALYDIPFVGVVPAIKPAAAMSTSKRIGLLATPATISRPYTDQLIRDHANDCDVVRVGSSELVIQSERLLNDRCVDQELIHKILLPFRNTIDQKGVDTLVLGCTHFPLLRQYLKISLPDVNLIDSGDAIAKRVMHLLEASYALDTALFTGNMENTHQLYFSKPISHQIEFETALRDLGFKHFHFHYFSS